MANLTYWRTNEFDRFRKDMDRMFYNFFNSGAPYAATGYTGADHAGTAWAPVCELIETDKTYVIKAELPGCTDKDLDVQVASNQLTIKGEKKADWDENKGTYHFTERNYGTFFRSFTLPNTVDVAKIRARYDRGILEVELPKTTTASLTKVKVENK
jgi:HSP20 family protein